MGHFLRVGLAFQVILDSHEEQPMVSPPPCCWHRWLCSMLPRPQRIQFPSAPTPVQGTTRQTRRLLQMPPSRLRPAGCPSFYPHRTGDGRLRAPDEHRIGTEHRPDVQRLQFGEHQLVDLRLGRGRLIAPNVPSVAGAAAAQNIKAATGSDFSGAGRWTLVMLEPGWNAAPAARMRTRSDRALRTRSWPRARPTGPACQAGTDRLPGYSSSSGISELPQERTWGVFVSGNGTRTGMRGVELTGAPPASDRRAAPTGAGGGEPEARRRTTERTARALRARE